MGTDHLSGVPGLCFRTLACAVVALLGLAGCADDPRAPREVDPPVITAVVVPEPVLEGSLIEVIGQRFTQLGSMPTFVVRSDNREWPLTLYEKNEVDRRLTFQASRELVESLGKGPIGVEGQLKGTFASLPFLFDMTVALELPLELNDAPSGRVHYNDLHLLWGYGFLGPGEGTVEADFSGVFTPEHMDRSRGEARSVSVTLPVHAASRFERDRAAVRLSTALGGGDIQPGVFVGEMKLRSRSAGGQDQQLEPRRIELEFGRPELQDVDPATFYFEQQVNFHGAGFVGSDEEPDEFTVLQFTGTFTPDSSSNPVDFREELVLSYRTGNLAQATMSAQTFPTSGGGAVLASQLFRETRGTFEGMIRPIVRKGSRPEVIGEPKMVKLRLGGMKQVVHLRFLEGFYDSLGLWGLSETRGLVEPLIARRMEDIYARWALDVRLEEPTDYSKNGFAVLEFTGPVPPGGYGLLGFDNTSGKDVGNLRLYDVVGSFNGETQRDGCFPFGGIFIEAFLVLSMHPPAGMKPSETLATPLFDEIFDPVRQGRATRDDFAGALDGTGDTPAVRALLAFANMMGESASHEIGHSLGLANPGDTTCPPCNPDDPDDNSATFCYHGGSADCIMSLGGNRSFAQRAEITNSPDYLKSRMCEVEYLDRLFGVHEVDPLEQL